MSWTDPKIWSTLALWLGGLLVGAAWQRVARRRANGEPNRR